MKISHAPANVFNFGPLAARSFFSFPRLPLYRSRSRISEQTSARKLNVRMEKKPREKQRKICCIANSLSFIYANRGGHA